MCFQTFVTLTCGHREIEEQECSLAVDQPFYLKAACPQYVITSEQRPYCCGMGKYYCQYTNEAQLLDGLHRLLDSKQDEVTCLERKQVELKTQYRFHRANDYARLRMIQIGRARAEANEVRIQTLAAIQEGINYHKQLAQYASNGALGAPPAFTIPTTMSTLLRAALQGHTDAAHSDVEPRSSIAITSQMIDVGHQSMKYQAQDTRELSLGDQLETVRTVGPYAPASARPPISGEEQLKAILSERPEAPASARKGVARIRRVINKGATDDAARADGRKSVSPKKPRLLQEASNTRRSARVRDKKVSYAESEGSVGHSREHSPAKSDVSGFSPSRSDLTESPAKSEVSLGQDNLELRKEAGDLDDNQLRRGGSSLSRLIGDWQKRGGSAAAGMTINGRSRRQAPSSIERSSDFGQAEDGGGKVRRTPSLIRRTCNFANLPDGIADAGPPTMLGLPAQHPRVGQENNDVGLSHVPGVMGASLHPSSLPTQANLFNLYRQGASDGRQPIFPHQGAPANTSMYDAGVDRSWLINAPAFNGLPDSGQVLHRNATNVNTCDGSLPMGRNDSVMGATPAPNLSGQGFETPMIPDYAGMRRSFSATTDLTPPSIAVVEPPSTDPKKRKVPTSSPLISSSKRRRVRLSLPSDEVTPGLPEMAGSLSSPSKMPSRETAVKTSSYPPTPGTSANDTVTTPAPVMAPTAIMYPPLQVSDNPGRNNGEALSDLPEHPNLNDGDAEGLRNTYSDIDWDLINEEVFQD